MLEQRVRSLERALRGRQASVVRSAQLLPFLMVSYGAFHNLLRDVKLQRYGMYQFHNFLVLLLLNVGLGLSSGARSNVMRHFARAHVGLNRSRGVLRKIPLNDGVGGKKTCCNGSGLHLRVSPLGKLTRESSIVTTCAEQFAAISLCRFTVLLRVCENRYF